MSSKVQAHPDHQVASKQRSSEPTVRETITITEQIRPAAIIQRARFEPESLSPHDVLQLQRTIGNQAVQRLLLQAKPADLEARSGAKEITHSAHDFSRIPVRAQSPASVQAKLAVSYPGDAYEQEADRVSEQVMRMPEPQLRRACACDGDCPTCQNEQAGYEHLQTKRIESNDVGEAAAPPIVHEVLRSEGQPMDTSTREFMESRFGQDFGQVRVHTEEKDAASANALGALAYTYGSHVTFGTDQYSPHSYEGRRLVAHELAHVVQQQSFSPQNSALHRDEAAMTRESRAGTVQLKPAGTRPTHIKERRGPGEFIEDAYGGGSLNESQWRSLHTTAEQALNRNDQQAAINAYLTMYADVAKLAQAGSVLNTSGGIKVVTGVRPDCKDAHPGLNFSLLGRNEWQAVGETGYVDDKGKFGVKENYTLKASQVQVATVLNRDAFKPQKELTLATMRHEMVHAEHDEERLSKIRAWLLDPKAKSDPKHGPDVNFRLWLLNQRLSELELSLLGGKTKSSPVAHAKANSELLGYVEGFMTAFHLTDPPPNTESHPVFVMLLGALEGSGVYPWALSDPSVRAEALGRLQEYYCHALDSRHREAFAAWVSSQFNKTTPQGSTMNEKGEIKSPDSRIADEERKEMLRTVDFFRGLLNIVTGKCKGLATPMDR